MPDWLNSASESLHTFVTISDTLKRLEDDLNTLNGDVSTLRTDLNIVAKDLAILQTVVQERQKTFEAQMRAIVSETILDLTVKFNSTAASSKSLAALNEPQTE
ncbi:MAG: hypothetical protein M3Y56_04870 [Armatimonadota bacterium]|nr:hypothetical protein [Armatimonadota bacterium]